MRTLNKNTMEIMQKKIGNEQVNQKKIGNKQFQDDLMHFLLVKKYDV